MGDVGAVVGPAGDDAPISLPTSQSINVLVTGFGPFKNFDANASFLIAQSLPSLITLPPKDSVTVGASAVPSPREVRLYVHSEPVRVSYATVREQYPVILDEFSRLHNGLRPDLTVHIGIASVRPHYSVETLAHRDDYRIPDVDGKSGFEDGEKIWKAKGFPPILVPGPTEISNSPLDDDVSASPRSGLSKIMPCPPNQHFLDIWKSYAPAGADLRLSNDAGHYLCDFIFYTSLARALEERRDRSSVFFHVPVGTDPHCIDHGTKIAVALIKSMIKCWIDDSPPFF